MKGLIINEKMKKENLKVAKKLRKTFYYTHIDSLNVY